MNEYPADFLATVILALKAKFDAVVRYPPDDREDYPSDNIAETEVSRADYAIGLYRYESGHANDKHPPGRSHLRRFSGNNDVWQYCGMRKKSYLNLPYDEYLFSPGQIGEPFSENHFKCKTEGVSTFRLGNDGSDVETGIGAGHGAGDSKDEAKSDAKDGNGEHREVQ